MREDEVYQAIVKKIDVTHHLLAQALAYARSRPAASAINSMEIIGGFCREGGYPQPPEVTWSGSISPESAIQTAGSYLSAYFASVEAIWHLVHENYFLPVANFQNADVTIRYRRSSNSSSNSGGWRIPPGELKIPQILTTAPSILYGANASSYIRFEDLLSPDLLAAADAEVVEAISDSIDCFRNHLYRPATIVLGKAAEGAWTEAGVAIARRLQDGKAVSELEEGQLRFPQIVRKTQNLYARPVLEQFRSTVGVSTEQLAEAAQWTDIVRESRNAIHFGVKPSVPNTYEKVAVLLLAGVPHFNRLYRIKAG